MGDIKALLEASRKFMFSILNDPAGVEPNYKHCAVLHERLRDAVEGMQEQGLWEYYYKVDGCSAKDAYSSDCICWHREGTGPYKDTRQADPIKLVTWRRVSPVGSVPEGYVMIPVDPTEETIDAMQEIIDRQYNPANAPYKYQARHVYDAIVRVTGKE